MAENHIHSFTKTVIPSTCKEHGYTLYKCECGYEHRENFQPLSSHNFEFICKTEPTCTKAGGITHRCSICGETKQQSFPPSHNWDEWKIQLFPTCTEEGKKVSYCTRCGESTSEKLPPKGHKLKDPKPSAEKGMIDYFCENCGQIITLPTMKEKTKGFIQKNKKKLIIWGCIVAAVIIIFTTFLVPAFRYVMALNYIESGKYQKAYNNLVSLDGFLNSEDVLARFTVKYKTIKETYSKRYEDEDSSFTVVKRYRYDDFGNILKVEDFDDYDSEYPYDTEQYEYEYDKNNNIISETIFTEKGTVRWQRNISYNSDGTISEETYSQYDINYYKKYEYDEKGRLSVLTSGKDGKVVSVTKHKYNDEDKLVRKDFYDENGILGIYYLYDYKNATHVIEKHFSSSDTLIETIERTYGKNGIIISEVFYGSEGGKRKYTEYNKNGYPLREEYYKESATFYAKRKFEYKDPEYFYKK